MKSKSILSVCVKGAVGVGIAIAAIGVCAGAVVVAGVIRAGRIQHA